MNKAEFLKQLEPYKDKFSSDVYEVLCNLEESEISEKDEWLCTPELLEEMEERIKRAKQARAEYLKQMHEYLLGL